MPSKFTILATSSIPCLHCRWHSRRWRSSPSCPQLYQTNQLQLPVLTFTTSKKTNTHGYSKIKNTNSLSYLIHFSLFSIITQSQQVLCVSATQRNAECKMQWKKEQVFSTEELRNATQRDNRIAPWSPVDHGFLSLSRCFHFRHSRTFWVKKKQCSRHLRVQNPCWISGREERKENIWRKRKKRGEREKKEETFSSLTREGGYWLWGYWPQGGVLVIGGGGFPGLNTTVCTKQHGIPKTCLWTGKRTTTLPGGRGCEPAPTRRAIIDEVKESSER